MHACVWAVATLAQASVSPQNAGWSFHLMVSQRSVASLSVPPTPPQPWAVQRLCPRVHPSPTPHALACNGMAALSHRNWEVGRGVTGDASAAMCRVCNDHTMVSAMFTIARCVGRCTGSQALSGTALGTRAHQGVEGLRRRSAVWKRARRSMDSRARAGYCNKCLGDRRQGSPKARARQ